MSKVVRRHGAAHLERIKDAVSQGIREGSVEAVRAIQLRVVPRVPVLSGELQGLFASDEAVQKLRDGAAFGLVTEELQKSGFYAAFVEHGYRTAAGRLVAAQPFFRPAVELARMEVRSIVADRIRLEIGNAA
ncbi:MAG: hypothetical protein ACLFPA_10550 [Dichotomicrobium sp.]